MSDLEKTIHAEARAVWKGVQPDPAFVERLIRQVEPPGRAVTGGRRWGLAALAGLLAALLVMTMLPGARALATAVMRQVFRIGPTEFIVNSGSDPAPPSQPSAVKELDPHPDADNQWFYARTGPLPAEAITAMTALDPAFRLPAWLPAEMPKRLQLPLQRFNGDDAFYSLAMGSNGRFLMVSARHGAWGKVEFPGTTKVAAEKVSLGGIEWLEVLQGEEVTYYRSIQSVGYQVFGPVAEREVLRKIAESLAPTR